MKLSTKKNLTAIWLFALLLNVFSIGLFAADSKRSAEMVFCPLTKKLQPVKASNTIAWQDPLENICADENLKSSFNNKFFTANLLKINFFDTSQFENLAFNFFQKGKSAFADLPQFPDFPRKTSLNNFSAIIGFGKTNETQFVWKLHGEDFSFAANPRPPNYISANISEPRSIYSLEKISRRIAPRAPPFSV